LARNPVDGIGPNAVKCNTCGNAVTPFAIVHRYTVTFDETRPVGLTLPKSAAETIARDANHYSALPDQSRQHSILTFAPSDMPGTLVRMRPFMGQLGTCPSMAMPDSHNAGDFGSFLVGAPHQYAITAEQLAQHKTDGHMDIDAVRVGRSSFARSRCAAQGSIWGTCTQARATARLPDTRWMCRAASPCRSRW
jgi:formamidase